MILHQHHLGLELVDTFDTHCLMVNDLCTAITTLPPIGCNKQVGEHVNTTIDNIHVCSLRTS